jgi:K319-like protein
VTFANPAAATTNAGFGAAGDYVLRLSATDGEFTATDDVAVSVSPQNQAPVVDAGPDLVVALPNTASLVGNVSDDGLPAGSALVIAWSVVSGPGTVTFASPNAPATSASFGAAGDYVLRLSATDGELSTSDDVTVSVSPQNQAPVVDAGPDQTVFLPAGATLNGTVNDDGLPAGGALTITWEQVSGPGTATFSNANSAFTTATFSAAGDYVLRLTASDGELSTSDEIAIAVIPPNQAPVVNAGADQTVFLPATAALAGTVTDDGLPDGSPLVIAWSKVSGPGDVTFATPDAAATTAAFATAGDYVLRLTASDGDLTATDDVAITVIPPNQAPTVNAGADQTVALPNTAALSGTVSDDGLPQGSSVTVTWSKLSGPGTVTFDDASATATRASFGEEGSYVLRLTATDGELSASDDVAITVLPRNKAPNVSAGADQTVFLPADATLNGTVSDDGFPQGSTLAISWTKVSGPGAVTFANASAASTTASFSVAGDYVLRLEASDGEFAVFDDVAITVIPPNAEPFVNAGPDQTVFLPATGTLAGVVTDDGLPQGSTLAIAWSKVSGPGNVTFANASSPATTAAFSAAGDFVLRLTASDGEFTISDDVAITVIPPNTAPVVNAGADQTVFLPATGTLNGSATDDGLPQGSSVTVAWSKVSGPGNVTFASPANAATGVSFSDPGDYVLRLSASDGELSASDDIAVHVVPPNQAPNVNAGADQTVFLPAVASLNGTASDDGLPQGSTLAIAWTKVSGPGVVAFGDANSLATTATFLVPGDYVLRLTVSDGEFAVFDELSITVIPPNTAPVVNAGADQTVFLPANGTLNGSVGDDGLPQGSVLAISWSKVSGPGTVTFANPSSAATTASFSVAGDYVLRLSASDGEFTTSDDVAITVIPPNTAPVVNAGADQTVFLPATGTLGGSVTDDGLPQGSAVAISWSKVSGPGTVTFADASSAATSASFSDPGEYVLRLTASDGEFASSDDVAVIVIPPNQAPSVNAGADQTVFLPATASLSGSVTDDGLPQGSTVAVSWSKVSGPGTVTFADASAAATTASFSIAGDYVLRLTASDGEFAVFDELSITVFPPNQAPAVNAGADQTVFLPATATLSGSVTDDGLPQGSTLTIGWSKVSGPGTVTFASPNSAATSASFSAAGDYVLRLSASDGEFTGADDVAITVIPPNTAPSVDAGADLTVFLPATATLSGSVTDDGLPQGSTLTIGWSKVSGPGNVTFSDPTSAATTASFSDPGSYLLRLTASDGEFTSSDDVAITVIPRNTAPTVNAGPDQTVSLPATATLSGSVTDDGLPQGSTLAITWSMVTGPAAVTFANPNSPTTSASFTTAGNYVLRLTASDTEFAVFDELAITVFPANQAPLVDAGADQTIFLPATATLGAVVIDDGLPQGSTLTTTWSEVSGPGTVTFANASATTTAAGFSAPGTYVLRETATDGEFTTSDDVTITVIPPNQAPSVNAGADQTVFLPANATLNGSVTDDGLPQGSTVTVAWSVVSGPGTVTFTVPNTATTVASFSAAGNYVLRLSASDGQLTGSDDVAITVIPPNQPPVVDAGPDRTILMPGTGTLNGSVTDDGLPQGSTLSISWSKLSGPGTVTFGSPTSAVTTVTFGTAGTYVLRLTASDGEFTRTDDVTIAPQNQPPVVNAGNDITVFLPSAITLVGTVTDDGLPAGSTVSVQWTKVSGPGVVNFTSPLTKQTNATFILGGTYVLRLTATDGELTAFDDVTVTVITNNRAPVVNAGPDQTVSLAAGAQLAGTATDDGLPVGSTLAVTWSKVNGPGTVTFADLHAASTSATFSVAGTYTLQLAGTDGEFTTTDSVIITVTP